MIIHRLYNIFFLFIIFIFEYQQKSPYKQNVQLRLNKQNDRTDSGVLTVEI